MYVPLAHLPFLILFFVHLLLDFLFVTLISTIFLVQYLPIQHEEEIIMRIFDYELKDVNYSRYFENVSVFIKLIIMNILT